MAEQTYSECEKPFRSPNGLVLVNPKRHIGTYNPGEVHGEPDALAAEMVKRDHAVYVYPDGKPNPDDEVKPKVKAADPKADEKK